MKALVIFLFISTLFTENSAFGQCIPEDSTPLSALPFDFDKFCKEKLDITFFGELLDTETFRERLLSDTTELGTTVASKFNSIRTTYLVLARNENFTLYLFRLSRGIDGEEFKNMSINALVTARESSIISVLEEPLNENGNGVRTFTVIPDLTVNIYSASMEQRIFGGVVGIAVGWVPVKEDKIVKYTINGKGKFKIYSPSNP